MPFRRGRRRRSRGPSKIRSKEWLGFGQIDAQTGSPAVSILLLNPITVYADFILDPDEMSQAFDEPTLLRVLFNWHMRTIQGAPADTALFIGVGLIKLSLEGTSHPFTSGDLANTPLPFVDGDSPWLYHSITQIGVKQGDRQQVDGSDQGTLDIRSRRKFENGEGLALVIWYETATVNTFNAWINVSGRLLFANR